MLVNITMEFLTCLFLLALSGKTRGENGELTPCLLTTLSTLPPSSAILVSSTRAVEVLTSLGQYLCSLPDLPDARHSHSQVSYQWRKWKQKKALKSLFSEMTNIHIILRAGWWLAEAGRRLTLVWPSARPPGPGQPRTASSSPAGRRTAAGRLGARWITAIKY